MNIFEFIKDVHNTSIVFDKNDCSKCLESLNVKNCSECVYSNRFIGFDENLEKLYLKLLTTISAYNHGYFADVEQFDINCCNSIDSFQLLFSEKIKDTFEGELTDFLFLAFDLMGYLLDDGKQETLKQEIFKSDLFNNIEEELTYFAVRLEFIKINSVQTHDLLLELTECVRRIFLICMYENIGIKTHIKLKFLYNYTL